MSQEQRESYMRKIFPQYWSKARRQKYGFTIYDKKLCELILQERAQNLLEVAIGTGYPIAEHLLKMKKKITGIDIAPQLIQECNMHYPEIKASLGNSSKLVYEEESFDLVYCFHSTWYFTDLLSAIKEMVRVVKTNRIVYFDLMNAHSLVIQQYQNINAIKNVKKLLKGIYFRLSRLGKVTDAFINLLTPTDIIQLMGLLIIHQRNWKK